MTRYRPYVAYAVLAHALGVTASASASPDSDLACLCEEARESEVVRGTVARADDTQLVVEVLEQGSGFSVVPEVVRVVPVRPPCVEAATTRFGQDEQVLAILRPPAAFAACHARDSCDTACALDTSWPLGECTALCAEETFDTCEVEASHRAREAVVLPLGDAERILESTACEGMSYAPAWCGARLCDTSGRGW